MNEKPSSVKIKKSIFVEKMRWYMRIPKELLYLKRNHNKLHHITSAQPLSDCPKRIVWFDIGSYKRSLILNNKTSLLLIFCFLS